MTNQEWKRRCVERISRAVKKAGRIRIRDLKRATHYDRGPQDESIPLWYDALEHLEKRARSVVCEKDEDDNVLCVMTPVVATALREAGVSPLKRVSPVACESQVIDKKDAEQMSPHMSPHMSPVT